MGALRQAQSSGAPRGGVGAELGPCQGGHFDPAAGLRLAQRRLEARVRVRARGRVRVRVRVRGRGRVRARGKVRVRVRARARVRVRVGLGVASLRPRPLDVGEVMRPEW